MHKPVLILLPGLLCDRTVWRGQAAAFAPTHDIRIPDLRGFDRLEAMAEQVLADAPARFALAGHSMGARIALEMYRSAPERVERLALLDTGTHGVKPQEVEQRHRLVRLAKEGGIAAIADEWLLPMVYERHHAEDAIMAPLRSMVLANSPDSFARQVAALLARREAGSLLGQIRCPTLVAAGRHDRWSPPAQHVGMAEAIPGARMAVIEEAGHMAPFEAPDAVSRLLREWLQAPLDSPAAPSGASSTTKAPIGLDSGRFS